MGYCPNYKGGSCYMYDKKVTEDEIQSDRTDCYTVYKTCEPGN